MDKAECIESALKAFAAKEHEFKIFMDGVGQWFATNPNLSVDDLSQVHSVKSRLKNREHLREKLHRKWDVTDPITERNIFERITDLGGVRVLHLYQEQFATIHEQVLTKVSKLNDWHLNEPPKAYTWDPESKAFFETLGIEVHIKESFYTSVHYLVRPRLDSPICCEIQVRTLFEEIWGEVDHTIKYPAKTLNLSCREQLLVLAKLVGAGSRLVDSIFRTSEDRVSERSVGHGSDHGRTATSGENATD
ncbi:MAG: RelA/SpoT domain protein [Bryobacterales bacterium]|nr:RelA/SpoT domain protein [Bryobacterales bacterium]